jgi:DNA (cytosine-5)-methyltransferase 1
VVTALSVCAGIAGIEIGLRLVIPLRTMAYIEREAYAASVLLARMEDESLEQAPVFCGNLEDFDAREFAGVDLVTAGLPCQPYSAAGQQKGDEDERAIWPEFIRIVGECGPALVFLENVPTFVTGGWFRRPGEELSRLGYRIEKPLFLAASDLGASHIRERVWILAHRNQLRFQGERRSGLLNGEREACRNDAHRCGCAVVANSASPRRDSRQTGSSGPIWGETRRAESERRCGKVAHTARELHNGSGDAGTGRWGESTDNNSELGNAEQLVSRHRIQPLSIQLPFPWPPGPSDWERWEEVGQALKPAFCRMADGHADSLGRQRNTAERLRCLGNAVVPQVAGFAFAYLAREAGLI